jgi:hypothetical protein
VQVELAADLGVAQAELVLHLDDGRAAHRGHARVPSGDLGHAAADHAGPFGRVWYLLDFVEVGHRVLHSLIVRGSLAIMTVVGGLHNCQYPHYSRASWTSTTSC